MKIDYGYYDGGAAVERVVEDLSCLNLRWKDFRLTRCLVEACKVVSCLHLPYLLATVYFARAGPANEATASLSLSILWHFDP